MNKKCKFDFSWNYSKKSGISNKIKWKWKWIKREKKEFQYLHAFTGFTASICASGRSGKDSARTKLVSYLYFPFISNKRQVKRGNCPTLISSGDYYLITCNLWLAASRYLAPFVAQYVSRVTRSVKFRNVAEIEKRCFCAIREFP